MYEVTYSVLAVKRSGTANTVCFLYLIFYIFRQPPRSGGAAAGGFRY